MAEVGDVPSGTYWSTGESNTCWPWLNTASSNVYWIRSEASVTCVTQSAPTQPGHFVLSFLFPS
jgi:hypothetical protein